MSALPSDHHVRELALDPAQSFIVEAPAGSGKTELLTRRYLKLLTTVQAPEEILAITFTRKAAAEMRNRVVKALALATNEIEPENPLEHALWSLARAVLKTDSEHGWQLLSHSARLRIMTIDSLNATLARQLPILSGAGAMLTIARDTQTLYAEVALRLVERLKARNETAEAIARMLKHVDNRYEQFELLLSQELARREYWLDLGLLRFDLTTLRAKLEATLLAAINDELAAMHALIPGDLHAEIVTLAVHAASVLNSLGSADAITACDALLALPTPTAESLALWRGIATLLLKKEGGWRVRVDKSIGFPPEDKASKQRMQALLACLQNKPSLEGALHATRSLPSAAYAESQWQTLTDLLTVLKLAITELEVVMRERGEADHAANAIAARRALGTALEPTDLALRVDYRLRHLLVDEFQDTSRGQVELLTLLTAGWSDGDGRTLFCVGDPMQSIYRFRHADVGLFLQLKRNGLNQLRLTPLRLTVNFRASRPVLDWVNRTFADVLPAKDHAERGAVAFTASDARTDAVMSGGVYAHAIVFDKAESSLVDAREDEARQIGSIIQTALRDAEKRVAVLVSNRQHLKWVIPELRSLGIPFQAVDIDPLLHRPVVQDLIALTRAIVHLADRTAWLAILRAPWCGLTLNDLHTLVATEPTATVWQLLNEQSHISQLSFDGRQRIEKIQPVLAAAIVSRGRGALRDCIERIWHALGGPATVTNESALLDAAAYLDRLEIIERCGDLEDIARLESHLSDLYAAADHSAGSARVELMTIHRAKGLEFDVVILPGLDSGSRPDDPPLVRAQELSQNGSTALLLAPIAARGDEADAIYQWLGLLEKERGRLEKGRVLYVAATRAESELHLFGAVALKDGALASPRANTFLQMLWPALENDYQAHTQASLGKEATQKLDEVSRSNMQPASASDAVYTRRLPLNWQAPVPADNIGGSQLRDVQENEPLHPDFEWVGETSRHVGTLVHREIDRIARTFAGTPAFDARAQSSRYAIELAELGVPPHLRDAAARRVIDALTLMLKDERGRWLLSGAGVHREAESELSLTGVVGNEIVTGVIDRTFIASDNTRWIVDFKTSSHEGGGLEEFLSSEVERYRAQLRLYAQLLRGYRPNEPIKAALYFPLLTAWREIPV